MSGTAGKSMHAQCLHIIQPFLSPFFMEIETDTINFLFGTANTEETDEKGLFHREKVRKAHLECIKQGRELPYVDAGDMIKILECIITPG